MRTAALCLGIAAVGCSFRPQLAGDSGGAGLDVGSARDGGVDAGSGSGSGSGSGALRKFPHLQLGVTAGSADVIWAGAVTIDTDQASITPALPAGDEIALRDPDVAGAPQLCVVRVRDLSIAQGAQVSVTGTHALVILATAIDDAGAIDAGAHGIVAGPGAAAVGDASVGRPGVHGGAFGDSGGGGGSFGTVGAAGGTADQQTTCGDNAQHADPGGAAGLTTGSAALPVLGGAGAGGAGAPGSCVPAAPGGGGGGAVQLSAVTAIALHPTATISAGGGGGAGGLFCSTSDAGAASGGGAGGAIELDAVTLAQTGLLAANGGGGGGGGCGPGGAGMPGGDGSAAMSPAPGGAHTGACGYDGGHGEAAAMPAQPGKPDPCGGNAGGGGGGAGVIVLHLPVGVAPTGANHASPAPQLTHF